MKMKKEGSRLVLFRGFALGIFGFALAVCANGADTLEENFQNPPASAYPHVWWHWMNGYVSKEGITADLEWMKRARIGGAVNFNIGSSTNGLVGAVKFMSPEWRALFKHAVQEADRLGIEMGMHNSSGWSGAGGAHVPPEDGMQYTVETETVVTGGKKFSGVLPKPYARYGHYRDIAVLALRVPDSEGVPMRSMKPEISTSLPKKDAQLFIDNDYDTGLFLEKMIPPYSIDLRFSGPFKARALRLVNFQRSSGTITLSASSDGTTYKTVVSFEAPSAAPARQHSIFSVPFPMTEARYYRLEFPKEFNLTELELLPRYCLPGVGRVVGQCGDQAPSFDGLKSEEIIPLSGIIDITSMMKPDGSCAWDVPPGTWRLLRIGHTANGVDIHPASFGDEGGLEVDKFSKLAVERCFSSVVGTVCSDLGPLVGKTFKYVVVDSYEGGPQNWTPLMAEEFKKTYGQEITPYLPILTGRVVESEAVTKKFLTQFHGLRRTLMADNFYGHLRDLCERRGLQLGAEGGGTNVHIQIATFHFKEPGSFVPMEGTRWAMSKFAQSCGMKIIGAEAYTARGDYIRWCDHPYLYKGVADQQFCRSINRFMYHTCVHVPWVDIYPSGMWGWGINFNRGNTWREQAGEWNRYVARCQYVLQEGTFSNDVTEVSFVTSPEKNYFTYIHYVLNGADMFFIANGEYQPRAVKCVFPFTGKKPEVWDPVSGKIDRLVAYTEKDGRTEVPLRLGAIESRFVVFRTKGPEAGRVVSITRDGQDITGNLDEKAGYTLAETSSGKRVFGANPSGVYRIQYSNGQSTEVSLTGKSETLEVVGPWKVAFPEKWGAPPEITLDRLISWSKHSDDGVQHFSGTATYFKELELPATFLAEGRAVYLDLGAVEINAEVIVNGQNLGILWAPPFRVEITRALKGPKNTLELRVTSTWANRLIGDEKASVPVPPLGDEKASKKKIVPVPPLGAKRDSLLAMGRYTFSRAQFWTKDDALVDAGLLGPVTCFTVRSKELRP